MYSFRSDTTRHDTTRRGAALEERAIKEFIMSEIQHQLTPVGQQLDTVGRQLDMMVQVNKDNTTRLDRVIAWMHEFWGNGTGRPGYYNERIAKEDEQFRELLSFRNDMLLEEARREGAAEAMKQLAVAQRGEKKSMRDWLLIAATAAPVMLSLIELYRITSRH
jgi:hypothetical protein